MKHCLSCDRRFQAAGSACPHCGFGPVLIDGFPAYAPDFARQGGGFDASNFENLAALEAANFWFISRNELVLWALRTYGRGFSSMLEIGCGTGFVLSAVSREFQRARLCGSEIFVRGLDFAARRCPKVSLLQMDGRRIPFDSEFDVVAAFDVIEHIREDADVLAQLFKAAKTGGVLLITVPQHEWLWSAADVYTRHERRYDAGGLHEKIRAAGFRIVRSTSFVSLLLPALIASRMMKGRRMGPDFDASSEFRIKPWLNVSLKALMGIERALIRAGVNFPAGGSRLVVAQKP